MLRVLPGRLRLQGLHLAPRDQEAEPPPPTTPSASTSRPPPSPGSGSPRRCTTSCGSTASSTTWSSCPTPTPTSSTSAAPTRCAAASSPRRCYTEDGLTADRLKHPTAAGQRRPGAHLVGRGHRPRRRALDAHDRELRRARVGHEDLLVPVLRERLRRLEAGARGRSAHRTTRRTTRPAEGDDVPGLSDCGIDAFGAVLRRRRGCRRAVHRGLATRTRRRRVRFTTWQQPGGATIIYVDPRKTFTANYAENNGGLHLQIKPGTDTALYMAICPGHRRERLVGRRLRRRPRRQPSRARRRGQAGAAVQFGRSFDEFREWITTTDDVHASRGRARSPACPPSDIERAAELLTGGGGARPRPRCCSRRASTGRTTTRTPPRSATSAC